MSLERTTAHMGNCFPCCRQDESVPIVAYEDLAGSASLGNYNTEWRPSQTETSRTYRSSQDMVHSDHTGYTSL